MAEMRDVAILGRDHPKVDALDKALGRAKFAADYYMPNMLYGGVYRSTVPHAIIKKLNMDKARALPGVACVLDYTAIPGKNRFGIIVKDEPCLVDDKVRRYGDAICVIAAETPEIVEEAKQLIEVEYEELPVINSFESALAEGAVCVHGTTNVHAKKHLEFGNVDEAWDKCDIIIENTYSTHVLSHMFIEPDAGIAYYDEKGIMTVMRRFRRQAGHRRAASHRPDGPLHQASREDGPQPDRVHHGLLQAPPHHHPGEDGRHQGRQAGGRAVLADLRRGRLRLLRPRRYRPFPGPLRGTL